MVININTVNIIYSYGLEGQNIILFIGLSVSSINNIAQINQNNPCYMNTYTSMCILDYVCNSLCYTTVIVYA